MARIRTVKPTFFSSLDVWDRLPDDSTRLHFIGLWVNADDSGRALDDPRLLKATIWSLDDTKTAKRIERMQQACEAAGLIQRYNVAGQSYYAVIGWHHQRIDKPQESKLPPPDTVQDDSRNYPGTIPEASTNGAGAVVDDSRLEGKGREGKGKPAAAPPAPEGLLREWYESRTPKPVLAKNAWPGMRSVVQKALDNGHPPDAVRAALAECDVVSAGWLEPRLRKIADATKPASFDAPAVRYR